MLLDVSLWHIHRAHAFALEHPVPTKQKSVRSLHGELFLQDQLRPLNVVWTPGAQDKPVLASVCVPVLFKKKARLTAWMNFNQ